jgi:hypothetical protein
MRFNDPEYIRAYRQEGKYPKIHDDIFEACEEWLTGGNVLEVGTCIGLLANRIIDHKLAPKVIAYEPNEKHLARAIKKPEIRYINKPISLETMKHVFAVMKANKIQTIFARRVFPEMAEGEGSSRVVKTLAAAAFEAGVQRVILEGRTVTKKPTAELWNADLEAKCFSPYFTVYWQNEKNVRVLERRK